MTGAQQPQISDYNFEFPALDLCLKEDLPIFPGLFPEPGLRNVSKVENGEMGNHDPSGTVQTSTAQGEISSTPFIRSLYLLTCTPPCA